MNHLVDAGAEWVRGRFALPVHGRAVGYAGIASRGAGVMSLSHEIGALEMGFFHTTGERDQAVAVARQLGLPFGVHHPFVRAGAWDWQRHYPPFTAEGALASTQLWETVASALDEAARLGASYLLFHFPRPGVVTEERGFPNWRNPDVRVYRSTGGAYTGSAGPSMELSVEPEDQPVALRQEAELQLLYHVGRVLARLERLASDAGLDIYLELEGPDEFLWYAPWYPEFLAEHRHLWVCMDLGRLTLQQTAFGRQVNLANFNDQVRLIHAWNLTRAGNHEKIHWPLHPGQRVADGWGDAGRWLVTLLRGNPHARILLEDHPSEVTPLQLAESRQWLKDLVAEAAGAGAQASPSSGV